MHFLQVDPTKDRQVFGWTPSVCFHELVRIMVDADLELAGPSCIGEGRRILDARDGRWQR
ncbi:MAG: hypothetical protein C0401_07415 [Anaerolinea sp.]|nr:hypothetical protein [Anaerolinea sp.]